MAKLIKQAFERTFEIRKESFEVKMINTKTKSSL